MFKLKRKRKRDPVPLTKAEMWKLKPGSVVYVEDLGITTIPKEAGLHAAVIFNWCCESPILSLKMAIEKDTIIAVQPAAHKDATIYWYIDSYEQDWLAYRYEEI